MKYCLCAFLAAAVQGFGMYNIHSMAHITEGGVLGVELLLLHWFRLSPALSSLFLNSACYFFGWKTFGKGFLVYSFSATVGYSIGYAVSEQFPPVFPQISQYPFGAAIIGSLFVGICTGICVRIGGAVCGDDALAMSISRITKIPIQWVYLATDMTILGLSLSYIPFSKIVWSLLTVTLSGQLIGWMQRSKK